MNLYAGPYIADAIRNQVYFRNGKRFPTEEESRRFCRIHFANDRSWVKLLWKDELVLQAFLDHPKEGDFIVIEYGDLFDV